MAPSTREAQDSLFIELADVRGRMDGSFRGLISSLDELKATRDGGDVVFESLKLAQNAEAKSRRKRKPKKKSRRKAGAR